MLLYNPQQSSENTKKIKKKNSLFIVVTKSQVNTYKNKDQNVCRFPPTMNFSVKLVLRF